MCDNFKVESVKRLKSNKINSIYLNPERHYPSRHFDLVLLTVIRLIGQSQTFIIVFKTHKFGCKKNKSKAKKS